MEKIKYAMKIVVFISIFIVLLETITRIFVSTREDTKRRQTSFYMQEDDIDVMFVGSSSIYTYISPGLVYDQAGFSSYNYAVPGMDVNQIKYALKECMKNQNPYVYVVDIRTAITYEDYNESDVRRLIDNMPSSVNRIEAILNLVEEKNKIPFYFSIIKYHERWSQLCNVDFIHITGNKDKDMDMGFETYTKVKEISVSKRYINQSDNQIQIAKSNENELRDLLKFCQEEKLNVMFICGVWKPNKVRNGKLNYVNEIVKEYGFEMLDTNDYYEEIGIDWNMDMNNKSHVNIFGAKKYSLFVADYLREKYNLPDRRKNSDYEEWKVAAQRFYDKYDGALDEFQ